MAIIIHNTAKRQVKHVETRDPNRIKSLGPAGDRSGIAGRRAGGGQSFCAMTDAQAVTLLGGISI